MGEVVDLRGKPKSGEPTFMLCGCTQDGTPMLVQAMTGDRPFIMGLLCPECDKYVPVVNGYIGDETA